MLTYTPIAHLNLLRLKSIQAILASKISVGMAYEALVNLKT